MRSLFHITTSREIEAAVPYGVYRPAAFAREGFVHASYRHQVIATANRIFKGREDLVVLEIDPSRISSRIVDENLEGGAELYPHIYGAIPLNAVIQVHPLRYGADGRFSETALPS